MKNAKALCAPVHFNLILISSLRFDRAVNWWKEDFLFYWQKKSSTRRYVWKSVKTPCRVFHFHFSFLPSSHIRMTLCTFSAVALYVQAASSSTGVSKNRQGAQERVFIFIEERKSAFFIFSVGVLTKILWINFSPIFLFVFLLFLD